MTLLIEFITHGTIYLFFSFTLVQEKKMYGRIREGGDFLFIIIFFKDLKENK
jgi:hypothetical protein